MRFDIEFHTPFRVGTGRSGNGSDSTVDADVPVPASSLKGVMRSAGRDLLKLDERLIDPDLSLIGPVFGTAHTPCPWSWSDATFPAAPRVTQRARIQIDPATGTVRDGALAIAEEVRARRATFEVTRTGWLDPEDVRWHTLVLIGCARAVTALGGDRRRGLGWVSIRPAADDPATLKMPVGALADDLLAETRRRRQVAASRTEQR